MKRLMIYTTIFTISYLIVSFILWDILWITEINDFENWIRLEICLLLSMLLLVSEVLIDLKTKK
jgi:hypothetical protein